MDTLLPDNKARVGIVILNYNRGQLCLDCVHSIMAHEDYPHYEMVVVDNASPDMQDVEFLKSQLPAHVHFIQSPTNGGYSAGNNIGARFLIRQFAVDVVFIVNSDVQFYEPILAQVVHDLQQQNIAAVSPIVKSDNSSEKWMKEVQVRRIMSASATMIANTTFLVRLPFLKHISSSYVYKECMPWKQRQYLVDSINGAAFAIKASVLEEIGYLDEHVFLYYEELLLAVQLKSKGYTCMLDASRAVLHFQGASTGARGAQIPYVMFRHMLNSFTYIAKHYYGAGTLVCTLFSMYKKFEFYLKRILLWMLAK